MLSAQDIPTPLNFIVTKLFKHFLAPQWFVITVVCVCAVDESSDPLLRRGLHVFIEYCIFRPQNRPNTLSVSAFCPVLQVRLNLRWVNVLTILHSHTFIYCLYTVYTRSKTTWTLLLFSILSFVLHASYAAEDCISYDSACIQYVQDGLFTFTRKRFNSFSLIDSLSSVLSDLFTADKVSFQTLSSGFMSTIRRKGDIFTYTMKQFNSFSLFDSLLFAFCASVR